MEINWIAQATNMKSSNISIEKYDVQKFLELSKQYEQLSGSEKGKYRGVENYIAQNGGPTLSSAQKNYKKILEEIEKHNEAQDYFDILPVDIYSEKETIMDLLASLENENYIKEIYKTKKLCSNGGLNTNNAINLMDCIRQGRSLLESSKSANMISKPLIDFYAASAYAYATIVINSPLHKSLESLKGSHGHTYNHKNGTIEFGGNVPSGTFVDLMISNYLPQVVAEETRFRYNVLPSLFFIQENEIKISLIALLSTVPELQDQSKRISCSKKLVYDLSIKSGVEKGKVTYTFQIGDGINKPDYSKLEKVFPNSTIKEENGKYVVNVPSGNVEKISPTIYHDIYGKLWYVESLIDGMYLPEICVHFLIISALCNIMRYSPHEWNNIVSNKISSDFSLLISKYLRLFDLKYPMLLVQQLTNFLPVIKSK